MSLDFDICYKVEPDIDAIKVFGCNISHNVTPMWKKAGIYEALYDSSGKKAKSVVETLKKGLNEMIDNPSTYESLEPDNGWGTYEDAILFLEDVIEGCLKYPQGTICISK